MHLSSSLALLSAATVHVSSLQSRSSACTNPEVRLEWSNLTTSQQTSYLEAELCLWNLPAETHLRNVTSRYMDLVALHQNLTDYVHWDGPFLPWHRYFMHTHQTLLRDQCDYTGWVETTLNYTLTSYEIIPDTTIYDVMDTEGGYLCYTYDY